MRRHEAQKLSLQRMQTEILPMAIERHMQILQDANASGTTLTKDVELAYKYGGMLGGHRCEQRRI